MTFPALNSLDLAELVVNEEYHEEYVQKNLAIFLFLFDLSLFNAKISRAYN